MGGGEAERQARAARNPDDPATVSALLQWKDRTRRFAFSASTLTGILIASMGVRALEPALGSTGLNGVNPTRQLVFRMVDVLLTGVVIAGGSDAIHKLVSVFTNGLDQINGNLEKNTPAAPIPKAPDA